MQSRPSVRLKVSFEFLGKQWVYSGSMELTYPSTFAPGLPEEDMQRQLCVTPGILFRFSLSLFTWERAQTAFIKTHTYH